MNEYSGNFDLNTVSSLPRWFGRVVSSASWQDNIEASHFDPQNQKGWGYRYRVRYFGLHSGNTQELPDDQLPMANVVMPVTSGSGLGGFVDTPTISAGTIVTGFFLDGMAGQEPYIDGILINSNNDVPRKQPQDEIGGLQLFNDTYKGAVPQLAAYVSDYHTLIKKFKRPSYASTDYKVSPSIPFTLDELTQRFQARRQAEQGGFQNIEQGITNSELISEIRNNVDTITGEA